MTRKFDFLEKSNFWVGDVPGRMPSTARPQRRPTTAREPWHDEEVRLLGEVELLTWRNPMPAAPDIRAGAFYHIYNRGVNRGAIFFGERNYVFFIQQLRKYFTPELAQIVAYCLMPTHYHLLVQVRADDFPMHVMQPFVTSYTKAINKQQGRVGPLFQGKYNARRVDSHSYLRNVTRYIHRNPVETGYAASMTDWPYSSYSDYIGLRNGTLPDSQIILRGYRSQAEYREFVEGSNYEVERSFERWLLQQEP